jgi:hypothetical protein
VYRAFPKRPIYSSWTIRRAAYLFSRPLAYSIIVSRWYMLCIKDGCWPLLVTYAKGILRYVVKHMSSTMDSSCAHGSNRNSHGCYSLTTSFTCAKINVWSHTYELINTRRMEDSTRGFHSTRSLWISLCQQGVNEWNRELGPLGCCRHKLECIIGRSKCRSRVVQPTTREKIMPHVKFERNKSQRRN